MSMAEIIYIALEKEPPDRPLVLVERAPSSRSAQARSMVKHRDGATFYVAAVKDWDAATADAVAWADKQGIPAVYVRGRRA
jgi:hypothetical protein